MPSTSRTTVKIEQETEMQPCQAKVGVHLRLVYPLQPLDGFQLHDHQAVHPEIESEAAVHQDAAVSHREWRLPFHRETSVEKFKLKTGFVCRFEKPRSQFAVNRDCGTENGLGN